MQIPELEVLQAGSWNLHSTILMPSEVRIMAQVRLSPKRWLLVPWGVWGRLSASPPSPGSQDKSGLPLCSCVTPSAVRMMMVTVVMKVASTARRCQCYYLHFMDEETEAQK